MLRTFVLVILIASWLAAQESHSVSPGPEKSVALQPHLGIYSHSVSTSNPEAQKFFDQGLNLLYGFNRYEALRSFRKAAELDPEAIMPLWGIAMALGPHINMDLDMDVNLREGCEALSRANALRATASEYERSYVEAAVSRCPEYKPDIYSDSMRQLHQRNPDDPDAATWYAESLMVPVRWKWWNADGSPAGSTAEAVHVLEQVMRRNPNHPGANHFYIHAIEMSPSPERAIPSAQRLMGIMPNAGHMVHMPSHIWVVLGDWETAAVVNERAAQVDREYFAKTAVQSGYFGYYIHNLHFSAFARSMQGRAADAIAAADLVVKESATVLQAMPEMVDAFMSYSMFARVRFSRWDDALLLKKPDTRLSSSVALWHWGRAIAYAAKKDHESALREADLFRTAKSKAPAQRAWLNNSASNVLELAAAVLNARLAPDDSGTIDHWRHAVEIQDRLNYDEPPAWYMPVRESLGGALLRSGKAGEAEVVFRAGLQRSPRNGRMLFGLMKSLQAQHKEEAANFVRHEFDREWKRADISLSAEDL